MLVIERRDQYTVNTDPQRRCYNGCPARSEQVWGEWYVLDLDGTPERLDFWLGLNQYAVDARGEGARSQFRIVEGVGL